MVFGSIPVGKIYGVGVTGGYSKGVGKVWEGCGKGVGRAWFHT